MTNKCLELRNKHYGINKDDKKIFVLIAISIIAFAFFLINLWQLFEIQILQEDSNSTNARLSACNELLSFELQNNAVDQRHEDLKLFVDLCKQNKGEFQYYFHNGSNNIIEGLGCMLK